MLNVGSNNIKTTVRTDRNFQASPWLWPHGSVSRRWGLPGFPAALPGCLLTGALLAGALRCRSARGPGHKRAVSQRSQDHCGLLCCRGTGRRSLGRTGMRSCRVMSHHALRRKRSSKALCWRPRPGSAELSLLPLESHHWLVSKLERKLNK